MKKTILLFSIIYCSSHLFAQNNFPSTGNVTIGTVAANARLSMNGTFLTGGANSNLDPYNPANNLVFLANSGSNPDGLEQVGSRW